MGKLIAPNGKEIVATRDMILGDAQILEDSFEVCVCRRRKYPCLVF